MKKLQRLQSGCNALVAVETAIALGATYEKHERHGGHDILSHIAHPKRLSIGWNNRRKDCPRSVSNWVNQLLESNPPPTRWDNARVDRVSPQNAFLFSIRKGNMAFKVWLHHSKQNFTFRDEARALFPGDAETARYIELAYRQAVSALEEHKAFS